ncbi:uncharacterized protein EI90DRAFT_3076656 [Cantharellus anzutake]|uniref:uncharacterized protein n=1 Tax=Cantharellus anzutake TaxID=1750568 RepID=UPI0019086AA6|nr:uncharacterized protein EI90DRAFT_3076656 [Cantharellus anzutake]KAF8323636.1 hypothetical protein EI90DRAFT_3076656 [Cantharellus anzutake]
MGSLLSFFNPFLALRYPLVSAKSGRGCLLLEAWILSSPGRDGAAWIIQYSLKLIDLLQKLPNPKWCEAKDQCFLRERLQAEVLAR